ncbi:MAG TPA: DUF423 domain-containing protein [Chthoniobacterales bacterium]|jgi:uncharacterized membrane protein YgdD (TMEM256/DUF423 family)
MKSTTAYRIAAVLGFLGVALGAFGAHLFQAHLTALDMGKTWNTASFYHMVHAVVLLVISREYASQKIAWWAFFIGLLLFSGSLYGYSLSGIKTLAHITPIGGLALLVGWAALVFGRSEPR